MTVVPGRDLTAPIADQRQRDLAAALAATPPGSSPSAAWVPGRCTLLGEHVDYAGGRVLACAIDLGVAVALTDSPDACWHVRSGDRAVVHSGDPAMHGDFGDRPLAAVIAAAAAGISLPPQHIAVSASLPAGAGLSSSAALISAVLAGILWRSGGSLPLAGFTELAWRAEHDVAGVPCGRLDHRAVVEARLDGILDLDCATGDCRSVPWPWGGVVLVVVDSGSRHDVGDPRYAQLRADAEAVLVVTGRASCAELSETDLKEVPAALGKRARHLHGEAVRVAAGAHALAAADADGLGALMTAGHGALRDLLDASTAPVEAMVAAALRERGCLGARLVGAGFGGSVLALCAAGAAERCAAAMVSAVPAARWVWSGRPAPGLGALSPELFDQHRLPEARLAP